MSKRFFTFTGTAVLLLARLAVAQDQFTLNQQLNPAPPDTYNDWTCTTTCDVYQQSDPLAASPQSYLDPQADCSTSCYMDVNSSINDNSSSATDDSSSSATDDSSSSSADTGDDGGSDSGDSGDDGGGLL